MKKNILELELKVAWEWRHKLWNFKKLQAYRLRQKEDSGMPWEKRSNLERKTLEAYTIEELMKKE